jgi:hypothetical protein
LRTVTWNPTESEQMPQIDSEKLQRLVELERQIDDLEEQLAPLTKERKKLRETLLNQWVEFGAQRTTMNGYTIYLERKVWGSYPQGKAAAIDALQEAGMGEYVNPDFQHQSVSKLVRELEKEGQMPPGFAGRIEAAEVFTLKAVKAG